MSRRRRFEGNRKFVCRGFEGSSTQMARALWIAGIEVAGAHITCTGPTKSAAKSRVRRKLDAVERAFRQRGWRC